MQVDFFKSIPTNGKSGVIKKKSPCILSVISDRIDINTKGGATVTPAVLLWADLDQ